MCLKLEVGKTYLTRGGDIVRVICTDRIHHSHPVIALRNDGTEERYVSYQSDGSYDNRRKGHHWDIVSEHNPHPHYEAMAQYAKDAAVHPEPWKLWEYRHHNDVVGDWYDCSSHPMWLNKASYRHKSWA